MRKDLIAATGALALVVGFVLVLGNLTGLAFGRRGPFDLAPVAESRTAHDGTVVDERGVALTFRGDPLVTVWADDGDMTPALRTAPIPDSLNRVVASMRRGAAAPRIVVRDLAGLDFALLRLDPAAGDTAFLIRITPDDAAAERSRTGGSATASDVAERWRAKLDSALAAAAVVQSAEGAGGP